MSVPSHSRSFSEKRTFSEKRGTNANERRVVRLDLGHEWCSSILRPAGLSHSHAKIRQGRQERGEPQPMLPAAWMPSMPRNGCGLACGGWMIKNNNTFKSIRTSFANISPKTLRTMQSFGRHHVVPTDQLRQTMSPACCQQKV